MIMKEEIDERHICTNMDCLTVYAEYVNGCPRCETGEVGGSHGVVPIKSFFQRQIDLHDRELVKKYGDFRKYVRGTKFSQTLKFFLLPHTEHTEEDSKTDE